MLAAIIATLLTAMQAQSRRADASSMRCGVAMSQSEDVWRRVRGLEPQTSFSIAMRYWSVRPQHPVSHNNAMYNVQCTMYLDNACTCPVCNCMHMYRIHVNVCNQMPTKCMPCQCIPCQYTSAVAASPSAQHHHAVVYVCNMLHIVPVAAVCCSCMSLIKIGRRRSRRGASS